MFCIVEHRSKLFTEMQVYGGSHFRRFRYVSNVKRFIQHDFYRLGPNGTSQKEGAPYDIALIRLETPFYPQYFPNTDIFSLNTVCLPHWDTKRYVPAYATLFGWGLTNHPNCPPADFPKVLMKGINVLIRENRKLLLSGQHFGLDSRICPVSPLLL